MASFNFKSFVKNIADKAQSEMSPNRRSSQTTPSEEAEGFICPGCMMSFASPQDLEVHYDKEHLSGGGGNDKNGNLSHLKEEVEELQTTLKEEQFYSAELKKEVERLSSAVQKSTEMSSVEDEVDLYETQIKALTEARDLLTREVMDLKGKLEESEKKAAQSEQISQKAVKLASENVDLKSKLDEVTTDKRILEEKMQVMETFVHERNNSDDVAVLRSELQNVQKIMVEDIGEKKEKVIDNLRQEKEELQKQYSELDNEHKNLKSKLVNLEERIDDWKEKYFNADAAAEAIKAELKQKQSNIDQLKQSNQELRRQMDEKDDQIEGLKTDSDAAHNDNLRTLSEESAKVRDLTAKLESLNGKYAAQESKVSDLNSQLSTLQSQYEQKVGSYSDLKSQQNELQGNLQEVQRHKSNLESTLNEVRQEASALKETIGKLHSEREDLMQKIQAGEGTNAALQQLTEQNETLASQLRQLSQDKDEVISKHRSEIDSLYSSLNEKECNVASLTEEVAKLESIGKETQAKLEAAGGEINKLSKELHIKSEKVIENERDQREAVAKIGEWTQLAERKSAEIDRLKSALNEAKKELAASEGMNQSLAQAEQQLSQKVQTCNEEIGGLRGQLQAQIQSKSLLETQFSEVSSKCKKVEDECKKLEADKRLLADKCTLLQGDIEDQKEAVKAINGDNVSLKTALAEAEAVRADQAQQLESALKLQEALSAELDSLRMDLTGKSAQCEKVQSHLEAKECIIRELSDQCQGQQKTIGQLSEAVKCSSAEKSEAEEKICQLQSLWEQEKVKQSQKLKDSEAAKELLLNSKVELQRQLDECKADLRSLQTTLTQAQTQKEDLIRSHSKAIQDLSSKHALEIADKEASIEGLNSDLSQVAKEVDSMKEELLQATTKASDTEARLNQQNRQLDSILSDKLELEAKVEAASDERRSLLERCLGAESELDRSRSTIVELRRKLDDSQAALHELGRENQSIQVELAKQTGRKWADDSEATACITCNSQFTITNRKHHCRNCGQIFCADCSAKRAPMPNFKNPQRVCDFCYSEIQQAK